MHDQMGHVDIVGVPIVDTSGRRLRLITSPTAHEAVASTQVSTGAGVLHLDALAASHRVRLLPFDAGAGAAAIVEETVACELDTAVEPFLPTAHSWRTDTAIVTFASTLREGSDAVDDAAAAISALDPSRSLVARFPGHALAYTAIEVVAAGTSPSWRSWHLYPGADPHVVFTTSEVALVPALAHRSTADRPVLQDVS